MTRRKRIFTDGKEKSDSKETRRVKEIIAAFVRTQGNENYRGVRRARGDLWLDWAGAMSHACRESGRKRRPLITQMSRIKWTS